MNSNSNASLFLSAVGEELVGALGRPCKPVGNENCIRTQNHNGKKVEAMNAVKTYLTLNEENFQREVLDSQEPVLVAFWADSCQPCHAIAPLIDSLAADFEGATKVGKVDVDKDPRLAAEFSIHSILSLLFFKDGKEVAFVAGVGTIESLFQANMDLLRDPPPFDLEEVRWPFDSPSDGWLPRRRSEKAFIEGKRVDGCNLVCGGVTVHGDASVVNCVISPGVRIGRDCQLEECVVLSGAEIGHGAKLHRVIVEEGARVPPGTWVGVEGHSEHRGRSEPGVVVLQDQATEADLSLASRQSKSKALYGCGG